MLATFNFFSILYSSLSTFSLPNKIPKGKNSSLLFAYFHWLLAWSLIHYSLDHSTTSISHFSNFHCLLVNSLCLFFKYLWLFVDSLCLFNKWLCLLPNNLVHMLPPFDHLSRCFACLSNEFYLLEKWCTPFIKQFLLFSPFKEFVQTSSCFFLSPP